MTARWIVALLLVLVGSVPTGTPVRAQTPGEASARIAAQMRSMPKHPKMDTASALTARAARDSGRQAALGEARARSLGVSGDRVRVIVESSSTDGSSARAAVAGLGTVEAQYGNLVQALLPPDALETVAQQPGVRYVRQPLPKAEDAVVDEAVASSGAQAWQNAGTNGAGVKIAIVDGGFTDYAAAQARGDLPNNLVTTNFCASGFETDDHGTAVAEIVYKMAPGAQLFLVCVGTEVNLGQAKDFAIAQGVSIISHSVSWFNSSRGDGSGGPGTPDAIAASARAAGILWVNSAGNRGQQHWSGTFDDPDGDTFHNFAPTDEGNTIFISSGDSICVYLKWDSWPTTSQDYDLLLAQSSDLTVVAASTGDQSGTQTPTESFCYSNNTGTSQLFAIFIERFNATQTPRMDLFITPGPNLEYQVAAGSVTEPGSSPATLAAGAVCWRDNSLELYSSQGPTIDGRTKPDLAGPDSTSSSVLGAFSACGQSGFTGTSASAPHVAGAAALVKQANPSFTPGQLQTFLQGRTTDLGDPGPDTKFGSGVLTLGSPPGGAAILNGSVTFQGLTVGSNSYQLTIDVRLFTPGATPGTTAPLTTLQATTDVNGNFSASGITPGTYDVEVKEAHRVGRIARSLVLAAGTNTKAFGDLLAGDTNGDDAVTLVDYSRMRASYGKCQGDTGFQPLADFNGDNCVALQDYSRLRANYGQVGPLNAP